MALARTIKNPASQRMLVETVTSCRTLEPIQDQPCAGSPNFLSTSLGLPVCTCQRRRTRTRNKRKWGSLIFRQETTTDSYHLPSCPYTSISPDDCQCSYGVTYLGLVQWLNKGIEIAFATGSRAGGNSISPTLLTFTMVDAKMSPAFAITSLLEECIDFTFYKICRQGYLKKIKSDELDPDEVMAIISSGVRRIWHAYKSGKASPKDYAQKGYSILHTTVVLVMVWSSTDLSVHGSSNNKICGNMLTSLLGSPVLCSRFLETVPSTFDAPLVFGCSTRPWRVLHVGLPGSHKSPSRSCEQTTLRRTY